MFEKIIAFVGHSRKAHIELDRDLRELGFELCYFSADLIASFDLILELKPGILVVNSSTCPRDILASVCTYIKKTQSILIYNIFSDSFDLTEDDKWVDFSIPMPYSADKVAKHFNFLYTYPDLSRRDFEMDVRGLIYEHLRGLGLSTGLSGFVGLEHVIFHRVMDGVDYPEEHITDLQFAADLRDSTDKVVMQNIKYALDHLWYRVREVPMEERDPVLRQERVPNTELFIDRVAYGFMKKHRETVSYYLTIYSRQDKTKEE